MIGEVMIEYVCGFLISDDLRWLVMIERNKKDWQYGKLNGIGGKIEKNESVFQAMTREFKEETGVDILLWEPLATLVHKDKFKIFFFKRFAKQEILDMCYNAKSKNGKITQVFLKDKMPDNCIENVKWLIPMALSKDDGIPFLIEESVYHG